MCVKKVVHAVRLGAAFLFGLLAVCSAFTDELEVRSFSVSGSKVSLISINSPVPQVYVSLNGTYLGTTPLTLSNLTPGTYRLLLQKKGYRNRELSIEVELGKEKNFYFDMQPITGSIDLKVTPPTSLVFIDGEQINKELLETNDDPSGEYSLRLTVGEHIAEVKLFGYADEKIPLTVVDGINISVSRALHPTVFSLTAFEVNPHTFNPDNPGNLGACDIRFSVSSSGRAEIVVADEQGQKIKTFTVPKFSTWEQFVQWDGRTESGERVPDGAYTVTVTAQGNDNTPHTRSASINVDSALLFRIAQITPMGSGVAMIPFAYTLPKDTHAAGFIIPPVWIKGSAYPDIPFLFRFVSSPQDNIEYAISGGLHFLGNPGTPVTMGASVKYAKQAGAFSYGALVRYGYSSQEHAFDAYGSGLGLSLVGGFSHDAGEGKAQLGTMRFYYGAASSAIWGGNTGVLSDDSPVWWKNALSATAQFGFFSGTLWAEALSAFTPQENPRWLDNISLGTQLCFIIPKTRTQIAAGFSAYLFKDSFALSPTLGSSFFF
jgi:hypothetical protein